MREFASVMVRKSVVAALTGPLKSLRPSNITLKSLPSFTVAHPASATFPCQMSEQWMNQRNRWVQNCPLNAICEHALPEMQWPAWMMQCMLGGKHIVMLINADWAFSNSEAFMATSKHKETTKVAMKSSEMLLYFHGFVQSGNVQSFYYFMQILPFSKPFNTCHLLKPMFLIWLKTLGQILGPHSVKFWSWDKRSVCSWF